MDIQRVRIIRVRMKSKKSNRRHTAPVALRVYRAAIYAGEGGELFFSHPITGQREKVEDCKRHSITFSQCSGNPQQRGPGAARSGPQGIDLAEAESAGFPGLPVTLSRSQVQAWLESKHCA